VTAAEDAPLAAMISTLAAVNAAQQQGSTWNDIAATFGYPSGRQAKKIVNGLRTRVKRELALYSARQAERLSSRP
jgi:hypothetical protein